MDAPSKIGIEFTIVESYNFLADLHEYLQSCLLKNVSTDRQRRNSSLATLNFSLCDVDVNETYISFQLALAIDNYSNLLIASEILLQT